MKKKPSKELFFETLNSFPECNEEERKEIQIVLNSMREEDKKIVRTETIVIED